MRSLLVFFVLVFSVGCNRDMTNDRGNDNNTNRNTPKNTGDNGGRTTDQNQPPR